MGAQKLYLSKLKNAGYSNTVARSAVFGLLLAREHEPMSMAELVVQMKPYCDRASVYRSVKLLEQIGIIKRLNIGWKYKLELSDEFHGHHHHITCTKCGKILAVNDDEQLEKQLNELAACYGFSIEEHQIDIRGLCQECKTRTSKETEPLRSNTNLN